ncbi:uncharacterized protein LOC106067373 isoform X1 [Biomphalaria glabrata]|uniref:Uncharacterized protein LOC106067373 isoform X1 n=1 Tax=Biomphalaria glabrata TaxID=6526 RepID=A0A9W2Z9Q7_BIOGL|nr:uncharacterized protein LOC106067373 isoform X1 [Biomphalaria glabrata]XP_055871664.1 uncharacterized protein LOC106067373 isoform X1 [Biomphalaria glabrata]XP_055871665.1 uncharacterized protein LOC106067373 isoform X1 [Biomphalaria glabrata]
MTVGPDYASEHKFPPLRLGPVSRVSTDGGATHIPARVPDAWDEHKDFRYPRIVVRDPFGRTLDTFTALQDAIYRASWARKKNGEWPKTPIEWRLPKAPVPARPDYSRSEPLYMTANLLPARHAGTTQSYDASSRGLHMTTNVLMDLPTLEIPVDDVAFVAESLNHLPELPSFTFLRHSILAGQSTYVQIVASILLHQKQLKASDVREAHWSFPGFCSGCKRAGFCYGCDKNSKPHVHEDIPAMTGGGFRFWKHDRPRDPKFWKNPSTWRVPSTEEELQSIIDKYGDLAAFERARQRAENDIMEGQTRDQGSRHQRLTNLGTYPPYITIVSTDDLKTRKGEAEEREDDSTVDSGVGEEPKRYRRRTRDEEMARRRKQGFVDHEEEEEGDARREPTNISEASSDRILYRLDTDFVDRLQNGNQFTKRSVHEKVDRNKSQVMDSEEEDEGILSDGSVAKHKPRHYVMKPSESKSGVEESKQKSPVKKTSRLEFVDKSKETEAEEQARLLRERAKENVPFGKKRHDITYTAPKFFQVQKKSRKITVAKDPFSTDRELDVPKGGTFELKKGAKKVTKFIEFKKGDRTWKAPKKFEVTHDEKKSTKFWSGPAGQSQSKQGQRRPKEVDESNKARVPKTSSDSGIGSVLTGDGSEEKDATQLSDDATKSRAETSDGVGDKKEDSGPASSDVTSPTAAPTAQEPVKAKRREIVKKTKVELLPPLTAPQSPPRLPSPPPARKRSLTPPSPVAPQSPIFEREEVPLTDIELPEVPDLPEIEDNLPEKRKQKLKFLVEPPPQPHLAEAPKKRKAAPKIRRLPKHLSRPRKSRPAEAPVTAEELIDIQDPLDFLAKYCIINPDRLPFYEIVFESTLEEQTPRYTKPSPEQPLAQNEQCAQDEQLSQDSTQAELPNEKKKKKGKSRAKTPVKRTNAQAPINSQLLPTERGLNIEKVAMTLEEQNLEKLIYTLDMLQDKMNKLCGQLEDLEVRRTELLAQKARSRVPGIASPNFSLKKKKEKKGKRKNKEVEESDRKLRPHEITDDVIVSRLDGKMLKEMCQEPDMKLLESEIEICKAKFKDVQNRVEQIAAEKLLADAFCMNHYFLRQGESNNMPGEYRRQQSEMYNRLRPNPDLEMNLEEVEEALQLINNHLLTDKEFYFLYSVLNLPRRERINFRLFSIIAALSEKVTQLDPVIRKLINNFDYNALDIKMEKCKELFQLLESEHMPKGAAQAASLAVELTAGGLRPEHTRYVMTKFNRDSKGYVDFLDFVTYVPLFVEIHKRIITDPLNGMFDL